MNTLIAAFAGRIRTVLLLLVVLTAAGVAAYIAIPRENFPESSFPSALVRVELAGVSPEDAERLLLAPLEQELRSIEGLSSMEATAHEGGARIFLEFEASRDMAPIFDDLRERAARVKPRLPAGVSGPLVEEQNRSLFPILTVSLYSDLPKAELARLALDLQARIQSVDTVLSTNLQGVPEERVEIEIDPVLLESHGIQPARLPGLFAASNMSVAAGMLDTGAGRLPIRVPGFLDELEAILDIPLVARDGAMIRVRDVATVRRVAAEPSSLAYVDGLPAVSLSVVKRTGANVVETVERVRAEVEAARSSWPDAVRIRYSDDDSAVVGPMLSSLQNSIAIAVLLILAIAIGALGLRAGFVVGISIPVSFFAGLLILYALGLTLNTFVLFALVLVVGMFVDNGIIIAEAAERRIRHGFPARAAYMAAAQRMAAPILSGTLTTAAAFVPLLFWPGAAGAVLKYIPLTLLTVLGASVMVALFFLPALGCALGGRNSGAGAGEVEEDQALPETGATAWILRRIDRALAFPKTVLAALVAVLAASILSFALWNAGISYFPGPEAKRADIQVLSAGNLSLPEKDALVREVEDKLIAMGVFETVTTRVGSGFVPASIGGVTVTFPEAATDAFIRDTVQEIRRTVATIPGIRTMVFSQSSGPGGDGTFGFRVSSGSDEEIDRVVDAVAGKLASLDGVVDVSDSRTRQGLEWVYTVDRARAAALGLDIQAVGQAIRLVTDGITVGTYRPSDSRSELPIVVRFAREQRSLDRLDGLKLETATGPVPLADLATREVRQAGGEIQRIDGERAVNVEARMTAGQLPGPALETLRLWVDEAKAAGEIPADVELIFWGQQEDADEMTRFMVVALLSGLSLILLILLVQFESFAYVLLILSAVVMSTTGVFLGLVLTGTKFDPGMTGLGIVALAGVVINNNIVLLDTYRNLAATLGYGREAILRTIALRFRPVLLTSVTTVCGLLPMAMGVDVDFAARTVTFGSSASTFWISVSQAFVFGMTLSTVMVLFFTPSVLMIQANRRARKEHRRAARIEAALG